MNIKKIKKEITCKQSIKLLNGHVYHPCHPQKTPLTMDTGLKQCVLQLTLRSIGWNQT
jgi:hypothetical protein